MDIVTGDYFHAAAWERGNWEPAWWNLL